MRRVNLIWIFLAFAAVSADWVLDIDLTNGDPSFRYSFVSGIISAVGALGSGVYGSIAGNKRIRNAEAMMDAQKKDLRAWRDAELGSDYLDRADSRAAMRRVFEYNKEAQKASDTNAIKRGMTDEAKVAQAARLNRNYADTVSQIAAAGAQHKDRVQQQYMSEVRNLDDLKIQNMMDMTGVNSMVEGIAGATSKLDEILTDAYGSKSKKAAGLQV